MRFMVCVLLLLPPICLRRWFCCCVFCSCNISNINHGLLDLNSDAICGAAFVDVAAVAIALSLPVPLLVPMPSVAQPPLLWPLLVPMPSVARPPLLGSMSSSRCLLICACWWMVVDLQIMWVEGRLVVNFFLRLKKSACYLHGNQYKFCCLFLAHPPMLTEQGLSLFWNNM